MSTRIPIANQIVFEIKMGQQGHFVILCRYSYGFVSFYHYSKFVFNYFYLLIKDLVVRKYSAENIQNVRSSWIYPEISNMDHHSPVWANLSRST